MPNVISPNMDLIIPAVGEEAGPQYAVDINASLDLIDAHDHSPGHGVQVTPTGLNINADLDFQANNVYNVKSVQFGTLASQPDYTGALYESLGDLWFNDEVGNKIRITSGGSVVNSGGISGLVPPASVTYTAGKFVFQSNTNVAAALDAGSIIIREMVASGKGITLVAPTALAANYSLTMPGALPGTNGSLTLTSTAGVQSVLVPGSSGLPLVSSGTNTSYAQVSTAGIANAAITNAKLAAPNYARSTWTGTTTTSASATLLGAATITTGGIRNIQLNLHGPNSDSGAVVSVAWTGGSVTRGIVGIINQTTGVVVCSWGLRWLIGAGTASLITMEVPLNFSVTLTPSDPNFPAAGTNVYSAFIRVDAGVTVPTMGIDAGVIVVTEL